MAKLIEKNAPAAKLIAYARKHPMWICLADDETVRLYRERTGETA